MIRCNKVGSQNWWDMITRLCIERGLLILWMMFYLDSLNEISTIVAISLPIFLWLEKLKKEWEETTELWVVMIDRSFMERPNIASQVCIFIRRIALQGETSCYTYLVIEGWKHGWVSYHNSSRPLGVIEDIPTGISFFLLAQYEGRYRAVCCWMWCVLAT